LEVVDVGVGVGVGIAVGKRKELFKRFNGNEGSFGLKLFFLDLFLLEEAFNSALNSGRRAKF